MRVGPQTGDVEDSRAESRQVGALMGRTLQGHRDG